MKRDRDEFSCPCCGTPTDSSYCAACECFECGEQEVGSSGQCLVPLGVECMHARHAAHYAPGAPTRGHDLLIVEVVLPAGRELSFSARGEPDARPERLPADFRYHSGSRNEHEQRWRFIRTTTMDVGTCEVCR